MRPNKNDLSATKGDPWIIMDIATRNGDPWIIMR